MTQSNKKISELVEVSLPTDSDYLAVVNNNQTKKVTILNFIKNITKAKIGLSEVKNVDTTTTFNILDSTDKRFVTDAEKTAISNTSGVNTGDQDLSGLVPKTTTVNGKALSGNITLNPSDIGAPSGSGSSSGTNTGDQIISDETIQISDVTTNNFSTLKHGFTPKGAGVGKFLRDDATWQNVDAVNDNVIEVTADYTALYENATLIVKNPCSIYLPQITPISKCIMISNQSNGQVTVYPYSGDLVHSDTSMIISFNKSTAQLKSSSLGWIVV